EKIELAWTCAIEKIALVASRIDGAVQLRTARPSDATDIMPGRERTGAEFPRGCQEITKFYALVAADARYRRLAAAIRLGEILDYRGAKTRFVIEHIVRDAQ